MNHTGRFVMELPKEVQEIIDKHPIVYPFLPRLYFEAKQVKRILELGINVGNSTKTILYANRDGNGHLWSIDWGVDATTPYYKNFTEETVNQIKKLGLDSHFTWVKRDFFNIPEEWFKNNSFDLIWVDVDNFGEKYFELVRNLSLSMHKGSKLMMHNIIVYPESKLALMELTNDGKYVYEEDLTPSIEGRLCGLGILTKVK